MILLVAQGRGYKMPSKKKTVLITGCSSGIGKATAIYLKEKKWAVYATARKEKDVRQLKKEGFESFMLDIGSSESIRSAVKEILERTEGTITALINDAGYSLIGAVEDLSRDAIRSQFETNVFGAIELTSLLLPVMRKQGYGKIIFISSVNGRFTFPFMGAYCASQHAIESFCDALRRELRGSGVFVTAIEPGLFKTKSIENAKEIFSRSIDGTNSAYADKYIKLFENFYKAKEGISEEKLPIFAETIFKVLESQRAVSRVIIPRASILYEIAHRFFPDRLQDFILFLKMKYVDKIY